MKIDLHENAADFLVCTEDWLSASEAENNIVLGVARNYAQKSAGLDSVNYWVSIRNAGAIVGCAFRTPPLLLALTRLPQEVIVMLAAHVRSVYPALPGVGGPFEEASAFAEAWSAGVATSWNVRTRLLIHELTEVSFPASPPNGKLRRVADAEIGLIQEWAAAFVRDTGIRETPEAYAQRLLSSPNLYLWDDQGARCMVAATRDTPTGVCVNAVYTPPVDRGCGYASAAVATLSDAILRSGKSFCCLYTDAANPTSNSIYQRIGYRPVREDVDIDFVSAQPD